MKVKVAQLILPKTRSFCVVSREVKQDSRGDESAENSLFPPSRFRSSTEVAWCLVLVPTEGRGARTRRHAAPYQR